MNVLLESPNYLVLLALADGARNGLGVQRKIVGDTAGYLVPRTTVYSALKVLVKCGMADVRKTHWQKEYEITDKGRHHLELASKDRHETAKLAKNRLRYR